MNLPQITGLSEINVHLVHIKTLTFFQNYTHYSTYSTASLLATFKITAQKIFSFDMYL